MSKDQFKHKKDFETEKIHTKYKLNNVESRMIKKEH